MRASHDIGELLPGGLCLAAKGIPYVLNNAKTRGTEAQSHRLLGWIFQSQTILCSELLRGEFMRKSGDNVEDIS